MDADTTLKTADIAERPSNGDEPVVRLSDLPEIPDFLGNAARVKSVAELLQLAQEQLQHLESIMVLNGQQPSDMIAMDGPHDTIPPTYQERFDSLRSGMAALFVENADIEEELKLEAVRRRKQVERDIENARNAG